MDLQLLCNKALEVHQKGDLAEAQRRYLEILAIEPGHFAARHMLGVVRHQQGRNAEALTIIDAVLKVNSNVAEAWANHGLVLTAVGRAEQALTSFAKALTIKSDYPEALSNRGIALANLRRFEEALENFDRALVINPDYPEALNNRGNVLRDLKRFEEAVASYDKALSIKPGFTEARNNRDMALSRLKLTDDALAVQEKDWTTTTEYADALNDRGNALRNQNRMGEALNSYDKALAVAPEFAVALYNRGNTLRDLKHFEEALASFNKALAVKPNYAEALNNRGNVLRDLKRLEDSLASYDKALALSPNHVEALNNRGVVLWDLKRFEEAVASYDKALETKPDYVAALSNRGIALWSLKRSEEALASYDTALAIRPEDAGVLLNRGLALSDMKRYAEALESYDRLLAISPNHLNGLDAVANAALHLCDWERVAAVAGALETHIVEEKSLIQPFVLLGYSSDTALQLLCAQRTIQHRMPVRPSPLCNRTGYRHHKIRLAYLSADFHEHATAYLMAELFERHDRSRFEVLAISFGRDDGSEMRARLRGAFDHFHDVRSQSDYDTAKLLRSREVDIAVDLKGFTTDLRPEILSYRPAPVQVNYLGYPGTMGADFIDYVIADRIVVPFDQQPFFTEKIVHLPDCYQVNDTKRRIAEDTPTRGDVGLPQDAFVFCCFNDIWKLTSPVFDVWMRLLGNVPGSVLWLIADNPHASDNLRKQAAARAIDPQRLIFAPRIALAAHLARHRLADLFLDTLPYNAHTTTSDALWAGLPVITCLGKSFAGRVAASLLYAVGLPELVTETMEDYESLALRLARDRLLLRSLRNRLQRDHTTCRLFDTDRFRVNIEAAYTRMSEMAERGDLPQSFSIAEEAVG